MYPTCSSLPERKAFLIHLRKLFSVSRMVMALCRKETQKAEGRRLIQGHPGYQCHLPRSVSSGALLSLYLQDGRPVPSAPGLVFTAQQVHTPWMELRPAQVQPDPDPLPEELKEGQHNVAVKSRASRVRLPGAESWLGYLLVALETDG